MSSRRGSQSQTSSTESSNESISSTSSNGSTKGTFARMVSDLSKKLSRRQDKDTLVGKNILKAEAVSPTIMQTKIALEKEKQQDALNRKLGMRPSKVDLKLRNILKVSDSNDSLFESGQSLEKSLDFDQKAKQLKSCLKKRAQKAELEDSGIIKGGNLLSPGLVEAQRRLSRSFLEDSLENKLRNRPDLDELESRGIYFCETVEVHTTFRKSEYNRKPDGDVTFKHLTPQLKVQIRNELNTFKKNEMEIHQDAVGNTCFHY